MLSDCSKCWDTPCTCGHGYTDWSVESLEKFINTLKKVLDTKKYTWYDVNKKMFRKSGFYVIRYNTGPDKLIWAGEPKEHFKGQWSFWASEPCYTSDHNDMGMYEWTSRSTLGFHKTVTHWRHMTDIEKRSFRRLLKNKYLD